ncbi:hypothetical protein B0H15DRAFT_855190, partial [Mycena belliarum]
MGASSNIDQLIQYTALAAKTTRGIADASNVPFFEVASALATAILTIVQSVKSHKEQCTMMVEQIHETLCTIIQLYSTYESDGALPPALLYDIARFVETLQKVYGFVKSQQGLGKIKQLLKHGENVVQLKACQEGLRDSYDRLKIHAVGAAANQMAEIHSDAHKQHEELLALLASHPEITRSDHSSSVAGTVTSLGASFESLAILPASPQIFHGRESELEEILGALMQDSARIAILGTGGMGKTSLATAALQHPDVVAKFTKRFFVPCHSTPTHSDLVSNIASYLGVAVGPNLARKVVRHLSYGPLTLLVLDNFETPWEASSSRAGVEEFLSLLTDIPQITMRGAERPDRVKWTRPFLQPLRPLDDDAALKTFLDIADDNLEERTVRELLDLTGGLPLAVNLIANVVSYEGCDTTLERWKTERTRVLSDGYDKKSSLDISIMLSFTGTRMTHDAQALLSILSLLPDGLADAELLQSHLPIPNVLAAKATLLRTALAYVGQNHRLLVLVPVREHVRAAHPPPAEHKLLLRRYLHELMYLWRQFRVLPSAEIVAQLAANLGNINVMFADGLQEDPPDIIATLKSIVVLSGFTRVYTSTPSPLMPLAQAQLARFPDDPVCGTYFIDRFFASWNNRIPDPDAQIAQANRYFERARDEEKAKWYNALAAYYSTQGNNLDESVRYRRMVLSLTGPSDDLTKSRQQAMTGLANAMCSLGKQAEGRIRAQEAQQLAEMLGDVLAQAQAISSEARCCLSLGAFQDAARLCFGARDLLRVCGLAGTDVELRLKNFLAEIHLLKTEFPEARAMHAELAHTRMGTSAVFDQLNLALVDTLLGAAPAAVRQNLDVARHQFATAVGSPQGVLLCDAVGACLMLREGDAPGACALFEALFAKMRS